MWFGPDTNTEYQLFLLRCRRYQPRVFWCIGCGRELAVGHRVWCPLGIICTECAAGIQDAPPDWWIPF